MIAPIPVAQTPLPFIPRPPRFFAMPTATDLAWRWDGKAMLVDGKDSMFKSVAELTDCLDVVETDEFGNPVEETAWNIAADKGDNANKEIQ